MAQIVAECWNCSGKLSDLDFGREETCHLCGRDTRVCKNCEHYEPSAHNQCRESQADRVVEKEKGNFCDYFRPSSRAGGQAAARQALKSAADALFKKK